MRLRGKGFEKAKFAAEVEDRRLARNAEKKRLAMETEENIWQGRLKKSV